MFPSQSTNKTQLTFRLEESDLQVVRQQFNSDRAWEVREILYQILTSNTENEFWGPFRERMRKNQRYCSHEGIESTLRNVGYLVWTTNIALENQLEKEKDLKQRQLEEQAKKTRDGSRRRRGSCLGSFLSPTMGDKNISQQPNEQRGDDESTVLSVASTLRASFASTNRGSFVSRSTKSPPGSRNGSWMLSGGGPADQNPYSAAANDDSDEPPSSADVDDNASFATTVPAYVKQSFRNLLGGQQAPAASENENNIKKPENNKVFAKAFRRTAPARGLTKLSKAA